MTNTKRADVHSPSQFIPAHYVFTGDVLDLYAGTDRDDVAALAVSTNVPSEWTCHVADTDRLRSRYSADLIGDHAVLHQCSICGARIRYAAVFSYRPEGTHEGYITSGLDCAENVDAALASELADKVGALKEFVAGSRRAVREAEATHQAFPPRDAADDEHDAWLNVDPMHVHVAGFLDVHASTHVDMPSDCFLCSVAMDLAQKGHLSTKQIYAVSRNAERAPAELPGEGEGMEVLGTVRSVKQKGESLFALIDVPERAFGLRKVAAHRVWLQVRRNPGRGVRVRFTADLVASTSDATFLIASNVRDQAIVG